MFRCKALKFRCALDILLLSIISKSKSFNCMLTSSIVIFQAAVWSIIFDNFWDTNDLSFNMLFTIDLFLNNDLFYNCIPHVCLTFSAHQGLPTSSRQSQGMILLARYALWFFGSTFYWGWIYHCFFQNSFLFDLFGRLLQVVASCSYD